MVITQHTCTARYGRVNSVVNAMDLRARCEGRGHIKMNVLPDIGKPLISIGKSKWFPNIAKTFMDLLMSKIIKRFPMSVIISLNREILDICPFDVPGPFYWHGLISIPAWISHHMPGKMGGMKSLLRSQTPKVLNGTVKIRKWIISSTLYIMVVITHPCRD